MIKIGILGEDIRYTINPTLQARFAEASGIPLQVDVLDFGFDQLVSFLRSNDSKGYRGFSVTPPYKGSVCAFVASQDEIVRETRAANTIVNGLAGFALANTEIDGFSKGYPWERVGPRDPLVIVGSGATARMIVRWINSNLSSRDVMIASRTPTRSREIIEEMCPTSRHRWHLPDSVFEPDWIEATAGGITVIHAASVPFDLTQWKNIFHSRTKITRIFDLNYQYPPCEIPDGADYVNGTKMCAFQAARAFELWTDARLEENLVGQISDAISAASASKPPNLNVV